MEKQSADNLFVYYFAVTEIFRNFAPRFGKAQRDAHSLKSKGTMKTMNFKAFVWMAGLMACFLYQGCQDNPENSGIISINGGDIGNNSNNSSNNSNSTAVRQVDMPVVIPVHPSSLKYFDYTVCYMDNSGVEYRDTIREGQSAESSRSDIYYVKSFTYKSLPVLCKCEVNIIPKVPGDSVVSFSYTTPKPYIFSRVIFNSHSYRPTMQEADVEGIEVLRFSDIRIGTFLSAYGSWFCSTCSVKMDNDGSIITSFY